MFTTARTLQTLALLTATASVASCTLPAPETLEPRPVIVTERPATPTKTPTKTRTTSSKFDTMTVAFDSIRTTTAAGTDYDVIKPKGKFIQVDLTISNHTKKSIPAPASAYKLQLADDRYVFVDFDASYNSHILTERLFGPIKGGQTSTRTIFFDIPKAAQPKTLYVTLNGIGHLKDVSDLTE